MTRRQALAVVAYVVLLTVLGAAAGPAYALSAVGFLLTAAAFCTTGVAVMARFDRAHRDQPIPRAPRQSTSPMTPRTLREAHRP